MFPPIYCLNLPTSIGRRKRMEQRFNELDLSPIFLSAIDPTNLIIELILRNYYRRTILVEREASCLASHLHALNQLLLSGAPEALICEDDLLFHRNFKSLYLQQRTRIPSDYLVWLLSYMPERYDGAICSNDELFQIGQASLWGAQLYLISRTGALLAISRLTDSWANLSGRLTSELITNQATTYFQTPVLAIEECLDSEIRALDELVYHRWHWENWGLKNYQPLEEVLLPIQLDPVLIPLDLPPIYCLNLKNSTERYERMYSRLKALGLIPYTTFVPAYSADDLIIHYFLRDVPQANDYLAKEAACLASHLNALKLFLISGRESALILEDDLRFRRDFIQNYRALLTERPEKSFVISLGYYLTNWQGVTKTDSSSLFYLNPDHMFGTQAYWITRSYAQSCLERYARPLIYLGDKRTSELIVREKWGLICVPPLVIEECIDSIIGGESRRADHERHFSQWGLSNYES